MRAHPHKTSFSAGLEAGIQQAVATPLGQESIFENAFGLGPLGMAVSDELARVIAASDTPFGEFDPGANQQVPGWVTLGNEKAWSIPPLDTIRPRGEVEEEIATYGRITEGAYRIAKTCIRNGTAAVGDTTLVAQSILRLPGVSTAETPKQVSILRASARLIKLWATLNDTADDTPGKRKFLTAAAVRPPSGLGWIIKPSYFEIDTQGSKVDWSTEARESIQAHGSSGRGCPALRTTVTYKGKDMRMIEAFWDGAVDVIAHRIESGAALSQGDSRT
jgi:hypothetical protein